MNENLWATIKPGEKRQDILPIDGMKGPIPVTSIGGEADGPQILISSGIHGSEYPGTLALIELAADLLPADVRGRIIMIHPLNVSAFKARASMILPEDGQNINRMFPGDPVGGPSARIAWWLTGLSDQADFYLDLHSGDLYEELMPYVYYPGNAEKRVAAQAKAAAGVLDLPYMVKSNATTGAYNSAALRGTPSLLIERGGAGCCRRDEVAAYGRDIRNVLKHLGVLGGRPEPIATKPVEIEKVIYLESAHEALWQSQVRLGEKVNEGQILGRVFDFFGRTIEEYRAEMDGVVLYQLYPLSANQGDILVAYGA